jgi:hypothetical protein
MVDRGNRMRRELVTIYVHTAFDSTRDAERRSASTFAPSFFQSFSVGRVSSKRRRSTDPRSIDSAGPGDRWIQIHTVRSIQCCLMCYVDDLLSAGFWLVATV